MDYCYAAKNMKGEVVRGTREAACERDVVLWLQDMSLAPLDIRPQKHIRPVLKSLVGSFFSRITLSDISFSEKVLFFRGLSFLLSSCVPLPEALNILSEQAGCARAKRVIRLILGNVDSGASFCGAISDFPKAFDPLCTAFVRAGEESGRLSENMSALAALLEAKERLRKKIISAMIYPAIVMFVAISVLIIMSAVVLPRFEGAFSAMNVPMPPVTAFVFSVGRGATGFWYCLLTLLLFFQFFIFSVHRYAQVKQWLDGIVFKLPIFGKMLQNAVLSRSFASMACLLDAGVPLPTALDIVGEVAANSQARQAFMHIREGVFAGSSMNSIMRASTVFPPAAVRMIRIGEETGRTGAMFRKLAENYESDLREGVKRFTLVLEPLMVIFVGALVAFISLAIFMPVVTAIESLT